MATSQQPDLSYALADIVLRTPLRDSNLARLLTDMLAHLLHAGALAPDHIKAIPCRVFQTAPTGLRPPPSPAP